MRKKLEGAHPRVTEHARARHIASTRLLSPACGSEPAEGALLIAQDKEYNTPKKCRDYLNREAIPTVGDEDLFDLQLLVCQTVNSRKRQKRTQDNTCSPVVFEQCKPVEQLKQLAEHVKAQQISKSEFIWVKGIITDIQESASGAQITTLKCDQPGCKGKVVSDKCGKCDHVGPGVWKYGIKLEIMCYDNAEHKTTVVVVDKGGKSLFGLTADQFHDLSPTARQTAINKVTFTPVSIHSSVTYDAGWDNTLIFPFQFQMMDKAQARASHAYNEYLRSMTFF